MRDLLLCVHFVVKNFDVEAVVKEEYLRVCRTCSTIISFSSFKLLFGRIVVLNSLVSMGFN